MLICTVLTAYLSGELTALPQAGPPGWILGKGGEGKRGWEREKEGMECGRRKMKEKGGEERAKGKTGKNRGKKEKKGREDRRGGEKFCAVMIFP